MTDRVSDLAKELRALERKVKLIEQSFGCPSLVYCLWKSGRHAVMRLSCKSWRCPNCAQVKIDQMTQALSDATVENNLLYEIFTEDKRQQDNITRMLRRKKISTLNVKFIHGLYIIADQEAIGNNWMLEPIIRLEAIAKIHSVNRIKIRRRDFTQDWRPEPKYEPKKDTVIICKKFDTLNDVRDHLEDYGQDIDSDIIDGDPLDLMERMLKAGGDLTLTFEV